MGDVVVEGHLGDRADGVDGVDIIDLQVLLRLTDTAVGVLEYGQIELLFAAEVVVDHPLGGAGPLGDLVDASAGVTLLGEYRGGDLEQLGPGALGVAQWFRAGLGGHIGELTGATSSYEGCRRARRGSAIGGLSVEFPR